MLVKKLDWVLNYFSFSAANLLLRHNDSIGDGGVYGSTHSTNASSSRQATCNWSGKYSILPSYEVKTWAFAWQQVFRYLSLFKFFVASLLIVSFSMMTTIYCLRLHYVVGQRRVPELFRKTFKILPKFLCLHSPPEVRKWFCKGLNFPKINRISF